MTDRRLSATDTVRALAHLGFPPISASTLRKWRQRGHLGAGRGYDPNEVAALLCQRVTRKGLTPGQNPCHASR